MKEIVYWIPVRTLGATEKDKIFKCSKCENVINKYDLEQLRFIYRNEPQIYENAIKEEFYKCNKCNSKMNMDITYGIIEHGLALGDEHLEQLLKKFIASLPD